MKPYNNSKRRAKSYCCEICNGPVNKTKAKCMRKSDRQSKKKEISKQRDTVD